jgi:hypothetical protein
VHGVTAPILATVNFGGDSLVIKTGGKELAEE